MTTMNSEPVSVGFVGLGNMGFPMAENLVSKLPPGSKVLVYDIASEAVAKFVALHPDSAVACVSAKGVTENAVSPSVH